MDGGTAHERNREEEGGTPEHTPIEVIKVYEVLFDKKIDFDSKGQEEQAEEKVDHELLE